MKSNRRPRSLLRAAILAALLAAGGCGVLSPSPAAEESLDRPGDAAQDAGEETAETGAGGGSPGGAGTPPGFDLELFAEGFERPVQIVPVPGGQPGRYLVVEQGGTVRLLEAGRSGERRGETGDAGRKAHATVTVSDRPVLDLRGRIASRGEQGLLSVAFHPGYPEAAWLFASYTDARGDSVVARYPVTEGDPLQVDTGGGVTVLHVEQPYANHNGGLILFGPDGYLYVGLGDGGSAGDPLGHGQNPRTLLGSLLRLDVDVEPGGAGAGGAGSYAIPADNPFAGGPGRPEIWASGLRNPWRFSFDRETGDLYIADVGQDAVEEVNLAPAGRGGLNFGWNVWEGSRRYSNAEPYGEVTFPVAEYSHEGGHCSITGGYVYRGRNIPPLHGIYLFSDLCSGVLWGLRRVDGQWRMEELADTDLQPVAFGEDLDGELFIVDHRGAVYRLVPGATPVPQALRPR